jgi:hypothetical protein
MSRVQFAKVVAALVVSLAGSVGFAAPSALDARYAAFTKSLQWIDGESDAARSARSEAAYVAFVAGLPTMAQLQANPASDKDDLALRVKAADSVAFYTRRAAHAREFRDLAHLLAQRGGGAPELADRVHGALLSARAFAEARAWRDSHTSAALQAVPEIVMLREGQRDGRVVMVPAADRHLLEQQVLDYGTGPFVIAVGYPLCHFSSNAVAAIENNMAIMQRFGRNIAWITPQDRYMDIALLQKWNAAHPAARLSMTYLATSWPEIDTWGTPSFYFFKDGKLRNKVEGWPKEGNFPALEQALASIGL